MFCFIGLCVSFYCPVALIVSLALNFETRNYHGPTFLRITLTTIALIKFHTNFRIFYILERKAFGILIVIALSNASIALGDNAHFNNNNTCDYEMRWLPIFMTTTISFICVLQFSLWRLW